MNVDIAVKKVSGFLKIEIEECGIFFESQGRFRPKKRFCEALENYFSENFQ